MAKAKRISESEWQKIENALAKNPGQYGMPEGGREKSLVLGSFNIRKLGNAATRKQEINFMARFCAKCDLVAIQEVQDNLDGLHELKRCMESCIAGTEEYGVTVSDITGRVPGELGMAERLAFIYRHRRIRRLELASDLTFDRTAVLFRLLDKYSEWHKAIATYTQSLDSFYSGKRKSKPKLVHPNFLTFVRTPYVVAFEAPAANGAKPLTFTAVNAHLIYGTMKEREQEFDALIEWLANRLKSQDRTVTPNFILMGDLNLNFDHPRRDRQRIDEKLRTLNKEIFGKPNVRRIYFPFLDRHPRQRKILRTNARAKETFDHFGFFNGDQVQLPNDGWLKCIDKNNFDGYDFGVFNFAELFSQALYEKAYLKLTKHEKTELGRKFEHSVSDHLPIWVRLPRPGF